MDARVDVRYRAAMSDPAIPLRDDMALAMLHAPAQARAALAALFTLDARLAQVARTTVTPIVGQMRLAWWRDALARLDTAPPPAEPVLAALAADLLPCGVTGAALADTIDGWEALVAAEGDIDLDTYARRGTALFAAGARVLGGDMADAAGAGWALADLSRHLSDPAAARAARALASTRLETAFAARWPAGVRSIGMLALVARFDLDQVSPAWRALRSIRFKLTGR